MSKVAVIKTGGKQYIAKENDLLVVDLLKAEKDAEFEFDAVATFDPEGDVEIGMPLLDTKVKAKVIEHVLGDKIRIAKFKAKSRYRKVTGFRPKYTRVQIVSIS
jgi:large subunit ribosomal protein L21